MNDLIERQAAIDLLDENDPMLRTREYYRKMIAELPSVTPQQKVGNGRWVKRGQDIYCSICNNESSYNPFGASKFSKYCPNCGAKMVQPQESEG